MKGGCSATGRASARVATRCPGKYVLNLVEYISYRFAHFLLNTTPISIARAFEISLLIYAGHFLYTRAICPNYIDTGPNDSSLKSFLNFTYIYFIC